MKISFQTNNFTAQWFSFAFRSRLTFDLFCRCAFISFLLPFCFVVFSGFSICSLFIVQKLRRNVESFSVLIVGKLRCNEKSATGKWTKCSRAQIWTFLRCNNKRIGRRTNYFHIFSIHHTTKCVYVWVCECLIRVPTLAFVCCTHENEKI